MLFNVPGMLDIYISRLPASPTGTEILASKAVLLHRVSLYNSECRATPSEVIVVSYPILQQHHALTAIQPPLMKTSTLLLSHSNRYESTTVTLRFIRYPNQRFCGCFIASALVGNYAANLRVADAPSKAFYMQSSSKRNSSHVVMISLAYPAPIISLSSTHQ